MDDLSLQQLLVTNFGLSPSGYAGSRGDTGYVGSGGLGYTGSAGIGYAGSAGVGFAGPRITSIGYPGNDTAADIAGGQTITLTGANFAAGAQVIINGNTASVVSVVDSTTITFTAPPNPTGSYLLYVVNQDGATTLAVPGLQYSGIPTWTTPAGSLSSVGTTSSANISVTATGDAPITYNVVSGSLPTGLTLSANTGIISGTAPTVASETTYNFTIRATDAQNQDTDRAFSIAVTVSFDMQYLVVGKGGPRSWGGGGAGGYIEGTSTINPGTTRYINFNTSAAYSSGATTFGSLVAINGGSEGNDGGSGGGGSTNSSYTAAPKITGPSAGLALQPGSSSGGYGYDGGTGVAINSVGVSGNYCGGGGGGAGGAGGNGINGSGGKGGTGGYGRQSNITGSFVWYCTGGNGNGKTLDGDNSPGAGTGYGWGGYSGDSSGGSGAVILAYPSSAPAITTIPGTLTYSVSTSSRAGYRVYTFTEGTGSITF